MFALIIALALSCLGDSAASLRCPRNMSPDPSLVAMLAHVEVAEGVPPEASGIVLAAACIESGLRRNPGRGDRGRAVGVLQFHGWANRGIRRVQAELALAGRPAPPGDPRLDVEAAARYWVRHFLARVPIADRDCPGRRGFESREEAVLASAEATAVTAPRCLARSSSGVCLKYGARCATARTDAETLHWELLRAWRAAHAATALADEGPTALR